MLRARRWCLGVLLLGAVPSGAQEASPDFGENLFVIEGKVQRPAVVVHVKRENLEKGFELDLRESFLDKILEALHQAPF